jgi:hypothetical protein
MDRNFNFFIGWANGDQIIDVSQAITHCPKLRANYIDAT